MPRKIFLSHTYTHTDLNPIPIANKMREERRWNLGMTQTIDITQCM